MQKFLTHLECSACSAIHSSDEVQTVCKSCGKSLLAKYDLMSARKILKKSEIENSENSFWKYSPLLPVRNAENVVSLGESMTPLIPILKLGKELGMEKLWVKDEGVLPTGSFKARGLAMALSKAKELGVKRVCIPSAGNAAGASSAYAARAGIECFVFMPKNTPLVNIRECQAYGARVTLVDGNISDAAKAMNEVRASNRDWFDVSTLKEPYRLEGKKTMGYELAEQFGWDLPDAIFYPTGGGTGLIGMWKAFDEMEQLGWIGPKRPKMISVQSSGCQPVVKAFKERRRETEFWKNAETIASGLRVPKPFADYLILEAVYASKGCAVAVPEDRIAAMAKEVATKEGLLICPEASATLLALKMLLKDRFIKVNEAVLLFNTATGLKYSEIFE